MLQAAIAVLSMWPTLHTCSAQLTDRRAQLHTHAGTGLESCEACYGCKMKQRTKGVFSCHCYDPHSLACSLEPAVRRAHYPLLAFAPTIILAMLV